MKNPFSEGDKKEYRYTVTEKDTATFESGQVHPVYATFALGRDAEWACRLFVLEMKEDTEEGIGTFLNVRHKSPALIGQEVVFTSVLDKVEKNNVICSFTARVGERVIAEGETGQKIVSREKLNKVFTELNG